MEGEHKMMLSFRLFVPFFDSVPSARWRYACVTASNVFDRGHHGRLWPHPHAANGEGISLYTVIPCWYLYAVLFYEPSSD